MVYQATEQVIGLIPVAVATGIATKAMHDVGVAGAGRKKATRKSKSKSRKSSKRSKSRSR